MEAGRLPCEVEEDAAVIFQDYRHSELPKCSKNDRFDSGFHSVGLDSESTEKELSDQFLSKLNLHKEHAFKREERKSTDTPLTCFPTREEPLTATNIFHDIDEDGDTFLHLTVIQGNPTYVWTICCNCPDRKYLDSLNKLHQTPLHLAVLMKQPIICEFLLHFKATVDLRDRNGQTPLHIACEQGLIDCVSVLTKKPDIHFQSFDNQNCIQDLEIMNYEGFTCLHLAVIGGHLDIITYLCKLGANVNAQDGKSGRTALHYAVEAKNEDLIRLLVDFKANINITTYSGLTPERLAKGRGYDKIHACLRELGAKIEDEIDEDMSDADSSDYDDLTFQGKCLSDICLNTDSQKQRTTYCLDH